MRSVRGAPASVAATLLALALATRVATAQEEPSVAPPPPSTRANANAAYGRLDGDLSFAPALGVMLGPRAPRGLAEMRVRYIEIVGLVLGYEDALGGSAEPKRTFDVGFELRPLFLGRFLRGMGSGSPFVDLVVDSVGVELGAVFQQPQGTSFRSKPALQMGLGFELPLFMRAQGLWLGAHGGVRFGERAFEAPAVLTPLDRSLYLGLTVSFHAYAVAHVVDAGDRRLE